MRLFYALWPDNAVQQALGEWAHKCHRACGGRGLAAQKLHVTLAFLGEVADQRYPALVDIGRSLGGTAFELIFDRIAYWRHSRIVYAVPSETPAALCALAYALAQRVRTAGLRTETRPFVPHVTLVRDARRAPAEAACAPLAWQVGALSLVETIRQDGNHAYRVRESWTLAR